MLEDCIVSMGINAFSSKSQSVMSDVQISNNRKEGECGLYHIVDESLYRPVTHQYAFRFSMQGAAVTFLGRFLNHIAKH